MWKKLIVVFGLIGTICAHGQEVSDDKETSVFLEVGYLAGGQVTTNTFLYQSGFSSRIGLLKDVSETFKVGLGFGMDQYDFIDFFPTYIHLEAKTHPEKNGYLSIYGGYAFTNEKGNGPQINQEFHGGGFLELGRAWSYNISPKLNLVAGIFLKHQFAESEIENQVGEELEETLNFDSLHFRIGINLR